MLELGHMENMRNNMATAQEQSLALVDGLQGNGDLNLIIARHSIGPSTQICLKEDSFPESPERNTALQTF